MLIGRYTRTLRFALIGSLCFVMQYLASWTLARAGMSWPIANATAFAGSAQLNFAASSAFTWRDRRIPGRRRMWSRWASYNATTLLSLAVNGAVFTASYVLLGSFAAAAAGVAVGAMVTYVVCNVIVFRSRRVSSSPAAVRPENRTASTSREVAA